MSARLSGSGMDRAAQCPASFALPGVHESSDYAEAGTETHARIESVLRGETTWEAAGLLFDPLACLPAGDHRCEQQYAYDPITDTARHMVRIGHRDYQTLALHEIPMTLDVVTFGADGLVTVTDWKSGFLGAKITSRQLAIGALAVSRAHQLDAVSVQIAHVLTDGRASVAARTLDSLELDAGADEARRIQERVADARATVAHGDVPDVYPDEDACRYCPAFSRCPAHIALARSVLALDWDPKSVTAQIDAMTVDEAGDLWARYKAGEKLLEAIGKSLRARAEREPLALPDGRILKMVQSSRTDPVKVPTGEFKTITFLTAKAVKRAS